MGNDNKIVPAKKENSVLHNQVMMFLDEEVSNLPDDGYRNSYNLEEEYAKTKKNHSRFTPLALLGALLVVLGTVFAVTLIITDIDKKVTVELSEFADLNLKTLLDSVAKIQTSYDEAVTEKTVLVSDRELALTSAENKKNQDIFVIQSMHLANKNEEKKRIEKVNQTYEKDVKDIYENYEPKLVSVTKKIEELDAQLKSYDASKIEAAQQQDRAINSERQVQELEKRRISEQYEQRISELQKTIEDLRSSNSKNMVDSITSVSQKYQAEIDSLDPVLKDAAADELIAESKLERANIYNAALEDDDERGLPEKLEKSFENYLAVYRNYLYLNKSVSSLPQKHSIPSYVEASAVFVNDMGVIFEETAVDLQENVAKLEENVGNLEEKVREVTDEKTQLEAKVENLNTKVAGLNKDAEKYKKSIEEKEKQNKNYEDGLLNLITIFKYNGLVLSAESKDNVILMVLPSVVESLNDDSIINVEIKAGKSIKGTLVRGEDGYFIYQPLLDKQGNPVDFDLESLAVGTPAKITVKK